MTRIRETNRRIDEFMLKPTPRVNQSDGQDVSSLTLRSLFDSEETPLLRYAFSIVGRRAVAEDIVQEVFLQLHTRWDEVESPKAWLYRSVRNRAFNYMRDNKLEVLGNEDSCSQLAQCCDDSPEAIQLRAEATLALQKFVDELDESDRQLVELKYFNGLKYRDISAQTGLSVGNVGYRLHHILKELAGKLRPLGIDGKS
ncbi:MAG: sigma-70 family RNA polymerase sigma factor [Pirellulaceae bacterium]